MRTITVPSPKDESLNAQLLSLYSTFKDVSSGEMLNFDLSNIDWFYPLLILPISAYLFDIKGNFEIDKTNGVSSYLNTIKFPNGIDSVSTFWQQIQKEKNYIPISILKASSGTGREKLESCFQTMVYKALGSISGAENAIYYPISELVTNIFEHSKEEEGFIFGQFYPTKNYLDICIIDRGRGLKTTYKQEKGLELSDEDAIAQVMSGNSTKPGNERGCGVRTSKDIVCKGLKGELIYLSGSSALASACSGEKIVSLPNFYWQGVIIAYRIPKPDKPIDITQYLN